MDSSLDRRSTLRIVPLPKADQSRKSQLGTINPWRGRATTRPKQTVGVVPPADLGTFDPTNKGLMRRTLIFVEEKGVAHGTHTT
jgi:hypothetical protein